MHFGKTFAALLLGAASAAAINSASHAADAVSAESPAAFNWSGIYVGFGGGVGAVKHGLEISGAPFSLPDVGGGGVFGEVTVGYDYMLSERVLIGAFADARFGNIGLSMEQGGDEAKITNNYGFDIGARAGYLLTPTTLGYVLGGYSWQHIDADLPGAPAGFDLDSDRDGYVLGLGVETAIAANWTLKSEYRYANYGTEPFIGVGGLDAETSTHTFSIGANYRLGAHNGGSASFSAPAYSWTGFYVGGALGAGAIADEIHIGGGEFNGFGGDGIFGELSVGYDHEFNDTWVAGIQIGGRYSGMTTVLQEDPSGSYKGKADYGFDVLARVGTKLNESTLAYVLGGYSRQHVKEEMSGGGLTDSFDWSVDGFSVGGGLETAVSSNVAVNLEYRYSKFEGQDYGSGGVYETVPVFHTVRVGAKYKFN
ncbi:outer membrane beta-barrel protein [Aminobacter sp. P9b]|uniref:Outer membrane immunogenic protein n=1 Tax=Aminobacter niigataensis TaxID=83265 RepID=A0ABR6KY65_9HYPH|nr:outer membrane beta-barrel protein [Aminobacter niigataensis]MBB4649457.1 outer membrane immunogenic protein [Aminobacter niigataensis]